MIYFKYYLKTNLTVHVKGLKQTAKNDRSLGYIFPYVKKVMSNFVPRASVVESEVEIPDKGWLSHDQGFQNNRKIFNLCFVINFASILEKLVI